MRYRLNQHKNLYYRALSVVFWLFVWQVLATIINDSLYLASPFLVISELFSMLGTAAFYLSIGKTFGLIGVGLLVSMVVGSVLGVLSYKYRLLRELVAPINTLFKTVPVVSFIILLFLLLPNRSLISTTAAAIMVFPPFYTGMLTALSATDQRLLEMSYVFKVKRSKLLYIYICSVAPHFISASKVALGLAWKAGIAAEAIVGTANTVGGAMQSTKMYLEMPQLLAWTVAAVLISVCIERLFLFALKRIVRVIVS